jgi:cytochrome P450
MAELARQSGNGASATGPHGQTPPFTFPSEETLECPYPFYAWMRSEAPVYQLPGHNVFFISRWDDIVSIVDKPELFVPGQAPETALGSRSELRALQEAAIGTEFSTRGLSGCVGSEHRLKRGTALKLVAPERLHRYAPFIERTVNELIDGFAHRGEVELVSEFSTPLPVRVVCEMLGVPEDMELFAGMMAQAPNSAARFLSAAELEERESVGSQMGTFMRELILARHADPKDDFISEFVAEHAARTAALPLAYLVLEATTLLFGGLVTTEHMFTNTMQLLLENPEELHRVLDDPSLIRPMLDESLRLEAPFHLTEMVCLADTEVAGVRIPAGAAVYKVWGSGNRDADRFEDPDAFRIGRPGLAKNHLGFGRGTHRCLGAPLALLEGTIAFEALLTRCRNLRFAPGRNDWTHVHVPSFRSLKRLYLEFDPE